MSIMVLKSRMPSISLAANLEKFATQNKLRFKQRTPGAEELAEQGWQSFPLPLGKFSFAAHLWLADTATLTAAFSTDAE